MTVECNRCGYDFEIYDQEEMCCDCYDAWDRIFSIVSYEIHVVVPGNFSKVTRCEAKI